MLLQARARLSKENGNACFKRKQWTKAVAHYTQALAHLSGGNTLVHEDDKDTVGRLLSNRSAARCHTGHLHLAAYDAFEIVLDLLPAWPKSYVRLGKACEAMGGHGDAKTWYVLRGCRWRLCLVVPALGFDGFGDCFFETWQTETVFETDLI